MTIAEIIERMNPKRKLSQVIAIPLYRNALYLIGGSFVTTSLGFFFWMTVARLYSTTEVGFGSAIISAINLIAILSIVGLNFSVIRFLPQAVKPHELVNSSLTLIVLVSLVVAAIFVAGTNLWSPVLSFVKGNVIFSLTFIAMAVMFTLSNFMNSVFVARRRAVFALYKDSILSLLKIPVVAGLAIFLHTFGVVASWSIALAVALAISVLLFLPRVESGYKPAPTLNLSPVWGVRQYAFASYVASLLTRVPVLIMPLMVVNLLGSESNAYFYVAWTIANLLSTVTRSISQSLFAEGVHSGERIKDHVMRSVWFSLLLVVPGVIILIAAGKWLLLAFGSSYSTSALELLWLLGIASLPRGLTHIYSGLLRTQDRLRELLMIRSFIAVAVLTLSWLIIPEYGIIGVGYVWLGIQVVVAIFVAARLVSGASRLGHAEGG